MNLQTRFWDLQTKFGTESGIPGQPLKKDWGAPWLEGAPLVRALSIKAASRLYGMVVLQNKYFTLYPFSMVGGCALPHAS
jgi:hypothetical protein